MNYGAVLVVLAVAMAWPALADDWQPVAEPSPPYVPRLGDIMGATQLRHFKLWYAGKEQNWDLADYELGQIKESFQEAMSFYPNLPLADMTVMAKPAALVGAAIKGRDGGKFARAFDELTTACNACHQSQKFGFIVIKVPTASPFSNQAFPPK